MKKPETYEVLLTRAFSIIEDLKDHPADELLSAYETSTGDGLQKLITGAEVALTIADQEGTLFSANRQRWTGRELLADGFAQKGGIRIARGLIGCKLTVPQFHGLSEKDQQAVLSTALQNITARLLRVIGGWREVHGNVPLVVYGPGEGGGFGKVPKSLAGYRESRQELEMLRFLSADRGIDAFCRRTVFKELDGGGVDKKHYVTSAFASVPFPIKGAETISLWKGCDIETLNMLWCCLDIIEKTAFSMGSALLTAPRYPAPLIA